MIALSESGPFVLIAHLRRGSVRVRSGAPVQPGDLLGECGNSGNSTQPHVHVQATDSTDWESARGLPMEFRRPVAEDVSVGSDFWIPKESEIVDSGTFS